MSFLIVPLGDTLAPANKWREGVIAQSLPHFLFPHLSLSRSLSPTGEHQYCKQHTAEELGPVLKLQSMLAGSGLPEKPFDAKHQAATQRAVFGNEEQIFSLA